MPVFYRSSGLIPAPFVSYSKDYETNDDKSIVGSLFTGSLRGKLSAYKGSPNSQGGFHTSVGYPSDETIPATGRMTALFKKQEALRMLFSQEGGKLEFTMWDGGPSVYCYPRMRGPIRFTEGPWVEVLDYEISFEADEIFGYLAPSGEDNFSGVYISKFTDTWNLEPADEANRSYKLTHDISAVGKRHYTSSGLLNDAWEQARRYVQPRLGLDTNRIVATGLLNQENFYGYNYTRTERTDKKGGVYGVNESWFVFNATGLTYPAFEDYTVDIRTDEVGRNTATINGTIKGLEMRNNSTYVLQSTRWQNASGYFNTVSGSFHGRSQSLAGISLHSVPLQRNITKNHFNGFISYGYSYDDRPNSTITNAVSEIITINDELPTDVIAQHVVPGRYAGPVIQSILASGARQRNLTIELLLGVATQSFTPTRPNVGGLVSSNAPSASPIYKTPRTLR